MRALTTKISLSFFLLMATATFSGCVHEYVLTLQDGDQILSLSKPKREGDRYRFTDRGGEGHLIPRNRVLKIQAISVTKEPQPTPEAPPRPRHWYLLWLA